MPNSLNFCSKVVARGYKEVYSSWNIRKGAHFSALQVCPIKENKHLKKYMIFCRQSKNLDYITRTLSWPQKCHILGIVEETLDLEPRRPECALWFWHLPFIANNHLLLLDTDTRYCALPALFYWTTHPLTSLYIYFQFMYEKTKDRVYKAAMSKSWYVNRSISL